MEHLKNEGLKNQARVITETLEKVETAAKLNKILDGKNLKENTIPEDEAAAFLVYLGLTEARYNFIKKFTDERGLGFLPTYANVREERKKCVADDLKCSDTDTVASLRATAINYLTRLLQDPDVEEKMVQVEKQYAPQKVEWQLLDKVGWDGSTQKKHKVIQVFIFFL